MNLDVLIVDDDEAFLFLHDLIVKESGLASSSHDFDNGKKAYEYLKENKNADSTYLVFLDINMPIMNGWQFLDAIQAEPYSSQILVTIVTSSIDTADREKAKLYPQVIDFVEKPLRINDYNRIMEKPLIKKCLNT